MFINAIVKGNISMQDEYIHMVMVANEVSPQTLRVLK